MADRGVIASSATTTTALGAATITYPNQVVLPIPTHQPFFIIGLTIYAIFPESITATQATFRVWSLGIVTVLAVPLFGVFVAANQPVFLQMSDPTQA